MGDTSIRVSEEAKRRLDLHKREEESYEDVIMRLTDRDKWAGFGLLADSESDTRAGLNDVRREMRDGTRDRIADEE